MYLSSAVLISTFVTFYRVNFAFNTHVRMGFSSCFKCTLKLLAVTIIVTSAMLFLPGLPPIHNMQFTVYDVAPVKKLEGPLALNSKLDNAERLFENMIKGPESIVYSDGTLYTSLHGGLVVKIVNNAIIPFVKFGKQCDGIHEEHICGRPLGLFIDASKSLYVADAYYGLYKVNTSTGEVVQLVSPDTVIEGRKPKLFNSVVVAADGKVYWTDSDSNVDLKNLMYSFFGDGTGRLIKYDPVSKSNSVLVDRLHFANGVALSQDESYVIVSETGRDQVHRHYLKGAKKGRTDVFVDGLPGSPDNIKADGKGNFYVSLVMPKDGTPAFVHNIGKYPLVRKFLAQSMAVVQNLFTLADSVFPHVLLKKATHAVAHYETYADILPKTNRSATIVKLDKEGKIIDSLHARDNSVSKISEIEIVGEYAYLASPCNTYLARVKLNKS